MKRLIVAIFILITVSLSSAAEIKLAWDANTESDLAGYKIYYGISQRSGTDPQVCGLCGYQSVVDARNVTLYSVLNLNPGKTYSFSATAYDTSGNESVFSNEVTGLAMETAPKGMTVMISSAAMSFYFYPPGTPQPTSFICSLDSGTPVEIPAEVLPSGAVRLLYPIVQTMSAGDHVLNVTSQTVNADGTISTIALTPQHILKVNSASGRWSYYYTYLSCDNVTGVCR